MSMILYLRLWFIIKNKIEYIFYFFIKINYIMDSGGRCYDYNSLLTMNCTSTWRGCIKIAKEKNNSALYELYPTGNATLDGREYCAIPKGTLLTPELKAKYNIW